MVTMMTECGIGTAVYRPPEHFLVGLQTLHLHLAADKITLLQRGKRRRVGAIWPWLLTRSRSCSGGMRVGGWVGGEDEGGCYLSCPGC